MIVSTVRKPGDRIQFRAMPYLYPDEIFDAIIYEVVHPESDTYYIVDAMKDGQVVGGAAVYEHDVIDGSEPFIKKRWYGCHCIVCPPPPRLLRKCWMRKRYRAHRRERAWDERRRYR